MADQIQPAPVARPPDDPAQESLHHALRASFNLLRALMVVLVVAYFLSGVFYVNPGERGLVVRFGQLRTNPETGSPIFEPGLRWALPDPFDEKIRISGQEHSLQIDTFLFRRSEPEMGKPLSEIVPDSTSLKPGVDGAMLSGDKNLSHGLWTLRYRVEQADQFVANIGENTGAFEPLLRRLAEEAVVRTASSRRVEEITYTALDSVAREVQQRLQASLDALQSGVQITSLTPETIEPGRVKSAYLEVLNAANASKQQEEQARQRREQLLNQAAGASYPQLLEAIDRYSAAQDSGDDEALQAARQTIEFALQSAGGQAAAELRQAQARASELRETVRQEVEHFRFYVLAYRQNPELTVLGLWSRVREAILGSKANETFFVPTEGDEIEIITNRDPMRAIEADMERFRRSATGEQP